jgi:chloramphenicol-sensitive protein RarD
MDTEHNKGLFAGIFAFAFWGFVPLFWKQIKSIPAYEIMSFRVVCALCVILFILGFRSQIKESLSLIKEKTLLVLLSTTLIGSNWLIYVWAVNSGYIVETSLGYFINPLMNVFLGVFFLGERLRRWQWVSISIAGLGVFWLFLNSVGKPWISIGVASTFALYGLVRKKLGARSLVGLGAENILLLPVALTYLGWLISSDKLEWSQQSGLVMSLTLVSGLATVLPLSAFGYAVKHLTLTTLGLIQYLAPTFQLLIGVLVYKEPFGSYHAISFSLIWIALLIYTLEGLYNRNKLFFLKRKLF